MILSLRMIPEIWNYNELRNRKNTITWLFGHNNSYLKKNIFVIKKDKNLFLILLLLSADSLFLLISFVMYILQNIGLRVWHFSSAIITYFIFKKFNFNVSKILFKMEILRGNFLMCTENAIHFFLLINEIMTALIFHSNSHVSKHICIRNRI